MAPISVLQRRRNGKTAKREENDIKSCLKRDCLAVLRMTWYVGIAISLRGNFSFLSLPISSPHRFPLRLCFIPFGERKRRFADQYPFAFLVLLPDLTIDTRFAVLIILPCHCPATRQQIV